METKKTRRFPAWIKSSFKHTVSSGEIKKLLKKNKLNTVCKSANCPNIWECFSKKTATLMIMGDVCTRDCCFCAVEKGVPYSLDVKEPEYAADFVAKMGLEYVVLTCVTRDDLPDGGASHFYETVMAIKNRVPHVVVEVLTSDFLGDLKAIETVLKADVAVFGHNVETVPRLYSQIRQKANYQRSLSVLKLAKGISPHIYTKTGLMLGLGETKEEVLQVLDDLRCIQCDFLTIGQYLKPSKISFEVADFIAPEIFDEYRKYAEIKGFLKVMSAPLVRSSYKAKEFFTKV